MVVPVSTMLAPDPNATAALPDDGPPLLTVVVDTEEEFDWGQPLSRANTGVQNIRNQSRAHRVFEQYDLKPTYVVDYPVASQPDGVAPLRELLADGVCDIGTHLHPWVNPPHDEDVCNRNSYAGNLPPALEAEKLRRLTETIAEAFGVRPTIYRAGRYGVGPATTQALETLDYRIDTSVVPRSDFSDEDGPSFARCAVYPFWFGTERRLLEVPLTVGYAGVLSALGLSLYRPATTGWGRRFRLPGLLARSRLLERVRLSPEGITVDEMCRLTRALRDRGCRVFSFTYHSPSLTPGFTPYVRTAADLDVFIDRFRNFFDFFFGTIGGSPATLQEVHALAARPDADG